MQIAREYERKNEIVKERTKEEKCFALQSFLFDFTVVKKVCMLTFIVTHSLKLDI
jgi:hypothetical protein